MLKYVEVQDYSNLLEFYKDVDKLRKLIEEYVDLYYTYKNIGDSYSIEQSEKIVVDLADFLIAYPFYEYELDIDSDMYQFLLSSNLMSVDIERYNNVLNAFGSVVEFAVDLHKKEKFDVLEDFIKYYPLENTNNFSNNNFTF